MKSFFLLVSVGGAFRLPQFIGLIFVVSLITNWKLHYDGYFLVLLAFYLTHADEVELVREKVLINDLEADQDIVVFRKKYFRNNKKLHQKFYFFCRPMVYLLFLFFLTRDVLEGLKIIPAL